MSRVILGVLCIATAGLVYLLANVVQRHLEVIHVGRRRLTLEEVLQDTVLGFVLFAASIAVLVSIISPWLILPGVPLAYVLSRRAPGFLEAHKRKTLRSACDSELDIMADVIAMGMRAGLSFDASLALYCNKFDTHLSRQVTDAALRWRTGLVSREGALEEVASSISSKALRRFTETVAQAVRYGSPLADMLDEFANDLRQERFASMERQVAKAPIKMLVPTGTCILPAMLILVMGPVLVQFFDSGF